MTLGDALIKIRGDRSKLGGDFGAAEKETKGWTKRIGDGIRSGLGKAAKVAIIGTTTAVIGLGAGMMKLALDAAAVEGVRNTFEKLTESVGGDAVQALEQLREATRGMVADADLMQAGNKFLAMGLADSTEGAAELAEVATQLGMAMGEDATSSMENFALMMANQSIPRLDSFGISSGKVRERILELMEATEGMTREQAFNQAVMEEARKTMERVGEQGDTTAAKMSRIKSALRNVALQVGMMLLPVLDTLARVLDEFVREYGPQIVAWLGEFIPQALTFLADLWTGTLLPALTAVWGFISDVLIPLFVDVLIPALVAVAGFISDTVAPAVSGLVNWFSANLVPALMLVYEWFADNVLPKLVEFAEFLSGVVAVVVQEVSTFMLAMFGKVVTWFQDNWPLIQETAQTVLEFLQNLVQTILTAISDFWTTHGEKIIAFVTRAWETIQTVISMALDVILGVIRAVMQAINGDWEGAWETIKGLLPGIWDAIKSVVGTAIEGVKGLISIALDGIEALWGIAWNAIKGVASTIWEGIQSVVSTALDGLNAIIEGVLLIIEALWENKWALMQTAVETIWDGIKLVVNSALKAIRDIIEFLLGAAADIIAGIWETITGVFSAAWDTITGLVGAGLDAVVGLVTGVAGRLYDAGKAIVEKIKQGISDAWGALVDWFNDKLDDLTDLLPWSEPKDPRSPLRGLGKSGAAIVENLLGGLELAMPRLDEALRGALAPAMAGAAGEGGMTQTFGPTFQIEANYRNLESESSLREDIQMLSTLYGGS